LAVLVRLTTQERGDPIRFLSWSCRSRGLWRAEDARLCDGGCWRAGAAAGFRLTVAGHAVDQRIDPETLFRPASGRGRLLTLPCWGCA